MSKPVEFKGSSRVKIPSIGTILPRFLKKKVQRIDHEPEVMVIHEDSNDSKSNDSRLEEVGNESVSDEGEGEFIEDDVENDLTTLNPTEEIINIELEEISLVTNERNLQNENNPPSQVNKKKRTYLPRAERLKRKIKSSAHIKRGTKILLSTGRNFRKRRRERRLRRRAQIYTERNVQTQPVYDYFWSKNLDRETKWYEDCYGICFPCCVGNPCSKTRWKDYLRLITSFIVWVSIADIIYLCVEIGFGVHPLSMFYHPNPTRLSLILIKLGGKYTYGIKNKYQVYRFLTAIFMHSDLIHLIFNLLVQFSLALAYEKNWKIIRMSIIYIFSGIAGNMFSSVIYPSVITVGASGSLLGVILAKLANVICRWKEFTMNERFIHICSIAFIITITGVMSFSPAVDWGSHLGGAIMGFILGMGLFSTHIERKEVRIAVLLTSLFASLFFFLSVIIIFIFYTEVKNFE